MTPSIWTDATTGQRKELPLVFTTLWLLVGIISMGIDNEDSRVET